MQVGDAYLIVYSITDRASFEKASELRIQLRRARQAEDIPIILVGNKSDLVRCREVSVSGTRSGASAAATLWVVSFACRLLPFLLSLVRLRPGTLIPLYSQQTVSLLGRLLPLAIWSTCRIPICLNQAVGWNAFREIMLSKHCPLCSPRRSQEFREVK